MLEIVSFIPASRWADDTTFLDYWGFIPQYVALSLNDDGVIKVYGTSDTTEKAVLDEIPMEELDPGTSEWEYAFNLLLPKLYTQEKIEFGLRKEEEL